MLQTKGTEDRTAYAESPDGEVYNALADLIRINDDGLGKFCNLQDCIQDISTRDVAEQLNATRASEGQRKDQMITRTVTLKLKALGFTLIGHMADNKTGIAPESCDIFASLMDRYGKPENRYWFSKRGTYGPGE